MGAAGLVDGVEAVVAVVVVEGSVVVGDGDDDGGGDSDGDVGLKGVVTAEIIGEVETLGVIRSHVEFVDLFDTGTGQPQENVKRYSHFHTN